MSSSGLALVSVSRKGHWGESGPFLFSFSRQKLSSVSSESEVIASSGLALDLDPGKGLGASSGFAFKNDSVSIKRP